MTFDLSLTGMPVVPRLPSTFSVVVISHNEGEYLQNTVDSLQFGMPIDSEIIVVDDSSTDGSTDNLCRDATNIRVIRPAQRLGIAAARNFGASHARGDVIVFSDAHVEVPFCWIAPLLDVLKHSEVGAVAPAISSLSSRSNSAACGGRWRWTGDGPLNWQWLPKRSATPYPVPLLAGCFIAMRRDVYLDIGGFDEGLLVYGIEDAEISMHLWTRGYQCWVVPTVDVAHRFRARDRYVPDYQRSWETRLHNELRLAFVHFGPERIRYVVEHGIHNSAFPTALAKVVSSNIGKRRNEVRSARRHDDDWFFRTFNMV